jgi:hypothetical protein
MLMSPLWPITARPGIHLLGAYVASLSRLRVNTRHGPEFAFTVLMSPWDGLRRI